MADSTTTTYPVARVYKDTGKFEGIEGVECGKTKINLDNEWSGLLSGDTIRCGNGWKFKLNSGTWSSLPAASGAMMFYGTNDGMYDTVVRLSVAGGSGVADITLLGNNWDCSGEANVSTIIFSDAPGWSATTITVLDENENTVGVFNGSSTALSWNASTTLKIPQDKRYKYVSNETPSISKQGICTFSEIVETGNVGEGSWYGTWFPTSYIGFVNGYKLAQQNMTLSVASDSSMSIALQNVKDDVVATYGVVVLGPGGSSGFNSTNSWITQTEPLIINRITVYNTNISTSDTGWKVYDKSGTGVVIASFENGVYDSSVGTYWDATTDWSIPYYERFNMSSISKSTGVLTCSEFVEGDCGVESRCASGFSGTISGNKITCNNGYQFELLLQSDQSAVNWSSVLGGGTGIFGLNGSATEDAINGSTFGGSLNTNDGYNTCTFTVPNSRTSAWITSPTLYVYSILTALVTTELYYLKITDPAGKSVLYENSTAAKETFYPIESGEDEWWIPSKYRYQNYLT